MECTATSKASEGNLETPLENHSDNADQTSTNVFFQAFAAGTIASSCCLFQLGLNLLASFNILHVGCAGFNTILGPLRPYTRAMTIAWLLQKWFTSGERGRSKCCTKGGRKGLIVSTVMCLTLMFMPEMLEQMRHSNLDLIRLGLGYQKLHGSEIIKMEYVVDNMGCEACINAVERLVDGKSGVVHSKVSSFKLGEIDIYVDNAGADPTWKEKFENELLEILKESDYDLHPRGWVTKKMTLDMSKTMFHEPFASN